MSLYDDLGLDSIREKAEQVAGWSSSIKLLQSQLQLKKTAQTQQPRRDHHRKAGSVLAPVIDLKKSRRDDDEPKDTGFGSFNSGKLQHESRKSSSNSSSNHRSPASTNKELEWNWDDEYDPMWPNDYEKVVKDLKDKQEREREKEEEDRKRKNREDRDRRTRESLRSRYDDDRRKAGFAGRPASDEEEEEEKPTRGGGVAIAPPPSLQEPSNDSPKRPSFSGESFGMMGGSSVAAKIMAKYGFKEGQGLGKKEQGIAMALQVEKTSKRGGRIISDKEAMMPVVPVGPNSPLLPAAGTSGTASPPPLQNQFNAMPPPPSLVPPPADKPEPSITEMMKNPSKVVLLRNMVGPGEVDEDLEPEVKDECNTKYGDVIKVIIYEQTNVPHEEAVRIFVEFKRIESAIKAVVDLNGRFFGGRQVKAGFYSCEKLNNLELL